MNGKKIFLDRQGNLPATPNVHIIKTEVDFLQWATDDTPILIQGEKLCAWAEAFYRLRGQSFEYLESSSDALRKVFPGLTSLQAKELTEKLEQTTISPDQITPVFILNHCYPDDLWLWKYEPSPEHAARWLIWLLEHTPTEAEAVILKKFASDMEMQAGEAPIKELYRATNAAQAETLLLRWLGAEEGADHAWDEFPLELPARWLSVVREVWMKRIIATNGLFFAKMLPFPLPLKLRQELARQTADYYREHSHALTREVLWQLQPYLNPSNLVDLEKHLPPPVPTDLPEDENAVLEWFEREYLPYRRWQAQFGDETARQTAVKLAQTFARWLLRRYPLWLLGGEHLSFQKSAHLTDLNTLTLCVILDGLPAWDAEWLVQELSARAPRLTLLRKMYCFTALPTVTEFAKDALLKGVPPLNAPQTTTLGKILPDNQSPKKHLQQAAAGEVWFWRVEQPDKAYHFEKEDKREREVQAKLISILSEIEEVAQTIPANIPLSILITSDHGRLLNPRSPHQLPVEEGMEAHGRVAWGNFQRNFPEAGFIVNENDGWVELYGERFGMSENLRIAWGEASFTVTNGTEAYPHGGLFPEEVIVPWFLFQRDVTHPKLEISLTGTGEADMNGDIFVYIVNGSSLELECQSIEFSHGAKLNVKWKIPPLSQRKFQASLTPWPPKSSKGKVDVSLLFLQPNGVTFTRKTEAALEVKVLYDQPDDLLKELGL
ncbi:MULTISPECIES: hypothetical protein [Anaerolinea]|uniref:hypothetical protein n=1 Tax=Anaerolinea TaxID=233189 RepID=UPI002609AA14|nr:hypothetical protein [Anaerolinea thermophila]